MFIGILGKPIFKVQIIVGMIQFLVPLIYARYALATLWNILIIWKGRSCNEVSLRKNIGIK